MKKCHYCDFNSHAAPEQLPEAAYVLCLKKDLNHSLAMVKGRKIHSIFFGGGTPSLFSANSLAEIIDHIALHADLIENCEVTLEVNPGTMEYRSFADFKQAGFNRISLGGQSFQNSKLKLLGRVHQAAELCTAIDKIKQVQFASFNVDIMYGLPQQTVSEATKDLSMLCEYSPDHISWYHLTLEPNTLFYHSKPALPSEDDMWTMMKEGLDFLASQGYQQYEISAYAKQGLFCQHNLNYWQYGDYIGVGAGAHQKISSWQNNELTIQRTAKIKHPKLYLACANNYFQQNSFAVKNHEKPFEFMLNNLRLNQGFKLSDFCLRTGLEQTAIQKPLDKAIKDGYLKISNDQIKTTTLGARYLNNVIELFI